MFAFSVMACYNVNKLIVLYSINDDNRMMLKDAEYFEFCVCRLFLVMLGE